MHMHRDLRKMWVFHLITLYVIPLRRGLIPNLDIGWWSVNPREPLVFSSFSDGCTGTHTACYMDAVFQTQFCMLLQPLHHLPVIYVYVHTCDM